MASREEDGAARGLPPAGNGNFFRDGPKILLLKFPKPIGIRHHCSRSPRRGAQTLASPAAMVIAVDGGSFEHEEEGNLSARYLPIGHVYSASSPAPSPRPPLPRKPRVDGGVKPPLKVYYRRCHKKQRVEDLLSSPVTAPREEEEESGPSRRKRSLKYELLSLRSAPTTLRGDGDADGEELRQLRGRPRRGGGAVKLVSFSESEKRCPGRPKGSVGRRWVE
jgi:hypothetical protein